MFFIVLILLKRMASFFIWEVGLIHKCGLDLFYLSHFTIILTNSDETPSAEFHVFKRYEQRPSIISGDEPSDESATASGLTSLGIVSIKSSPPVETVSSLLAR